MTLSFGNTQIRIEISRFGKVSDSCEAKGGHSGKGIMSLRMTLPSRLCPSFDSGGEEAGRRCGLSKERRLQGSVLTLLMRAPLAATANQLRGRLGTLSP